MVIGGVEGYVQAEETDEDDEARIRGFALCFPALALEALEPSLCECHCRKVSSR
jgi:hypothetical protein